MVEKTGENKQLEGQQANGQEPKEKVSTGKRISMAFSDMYGFIRKPKKSQDQPVAEGESSPGSGAKKPAVALPTFFNTQKINLKNVNQTLVIVLIGLIAMMFFVTFRKRPDISSVTAAVSKIKFLEAEPKMITAFHQVSHYMEQIKKRDIFSVFEEKKPPPPDVVAEEPPPPPPEPKVPIEQKAKNYKLIGISWGSNPKAIIRDISTEEVLFMSEGETIKGTDLTIEKVYKEEVVITSEGEEMSML